MTFGERLTSLRKEYGYKSRNDFAIKLGIPSTTLRNYETNAREPGHTFLKQISEFFNVSVDYLLCLTDDKEVLHTFRLRSTEQDIIEKYRDLEPLGQEHVQTVLEWETDRVSSLNMPKEQSEHLYNFELPTENTDQPTRTLNYYQRLASAGTGQIVFDDVPVDLIEIPNIPEYDRVKYAIGDRKSVV